MDAAARREARKGWTGQVFRYWRAAGRPQDLADVAALERLRDIGAKG